MVKKINKGYFIGLFYQAIRKISELNKCEIEAIANKDRLLSELKNLPLL